MYILINFILLFHFYYVLIIYSLQYRYSNSFDLANNSITQLNEICRTKYILGAEKLNDRYFYINYEEKTEVFEFETCRTICVLENISYCDNFFDNKVIMFITTKNEWLFYENNTLKHIVTLRGFEENMETEKDKSSFYKKKPFCFKKSSTDLFWWKTKNEIHFWYLELK